MAPSGPAPMSAGPLSTVGMGNSVMAPAVVIRPILLPPNSANQTAPSGPAVIPEGKLVAVGIGSSVIARPPATLARLVPRRVSTIRNRRSLARADLRSGSEEMAVGEEIEPPIPKNREIRKPASIRRFLTQVSPLKCPVWQKCDVREQPESSWLLRTPHANALIRRRKSSGWLRSPNLYSRSERAARFPPDSLPRIRKPNSLAYCPPSVVG